MITTNVNEQGRRAAAVWGRRRDFWHKAVIALGLPHLLLLPLQFAVEDEAGSTAILAVSVTLFVIQIVAVFRHRFCCRRADQSGVSA